jgi:hypothetical protein
MVLKGVAFAGYSRERASHRRAGFAGVVKRS